MKIKRKLKNL